MAEAFLNHLCDDKFKAESAGITPTGINPYVKRVMAEVGIDVSNARSKSIMEFQGRHFDFVVTVCDQAKEACPFFPGEKEISRSFPDPSAFTGTDEEILARVRAVRDEIKEWVKNTFCLGGADQQRTISALKNRV
jgi:arsenate reductase